MGIKKQTHQGMPGRPLIEELETRLLYSADAAPFAAPPAEVVETRLLDLATPRPPAGDDALQFLDIPEVTNPVGTQTAAPREVIFVDTGVDGYEELLESLLDSIPAGRQPSIILLDTGSDGIEQIGGSLSEYGSVSAIHILSHADAGEVSLGSTRLSLDNLDEFSNALLGWNANLTADADILIYGCNLAASGDGTALIDNIATLTGADVAASDDLTGNAKSSGDWDLEYRNGSIEAATLAPVSNGWQGTLVLTATNETRVNSSTTGVQTTATEVRGSRNAVAMDSNGNHVVVWSDANGSGYDVFAQRYDASGNKVGQELPVNTVTTNDQYHASIAMADNGDFTVTWTSVNQDGTSSSIYARRFDANGNAIDNVEFRVNDTSSGAQSNPAIAMAGDGRFIITWQGAGSGDSDGIFGKLYDATGNGGSEFRINTTTNNAQVDPAVAMNDNGDSAVVWISGDNAYLELIDASGNLAEIEKKVNTLSGVSRAAIALANDGSSVVAFRYWDNYVILLGDPDDGIYYRTFDNTGSETTQLSGGAPPGVDIGPDLDATSPSISIDKDTGSFVVTWEKSGDGSGTAVYAKAFKADQSLLWDTTQINVTTGGSQAMASVAALNPNHFAVVWSGTGTESGNVDADGVFIRLYTTGPIAIAGGPYTISEGDDSLTLNGSASSDPDGDTLSYAWDLNNDGTYGDATGVNPSVDWATLKSFGINDDGSYTIGLQVDDGNGNTATTSATLTVSNTAPTLTVTGASAAYVGGSYTLNLAASDPGNDTIGSWTINWGDGNIDTMAGSATTATHVYANSGFTYNILVSATDEDKPTGYIHNDLFAGHYATNAGVYRIQGSWGNPPAEFANEGNLDKAIQPVVGPDGMLYISGETSANVVRYNPAAGVLDTEFANLPGGSAGGLAFGPDGNLYVADYSKKNIVAFDATTGNSLGNLVSGLPDRPYGIAFGPDGNLYVGLYSTATVQKYDGTTGADLGTFVTTGSGGLTTPEQITFGPDGNLYITDVATGKNNVLRFNGSTGAFIDEFVAAGAGGLSKPDGLAFGPDGNLYVADSSNGVIRRYDGGNGNYVDDYATSLTNPSFLSFGPDLQVTVQDGIIVDTASDTDDGDTSSIAALLANKGTDGAISLREAILAANNTANGSAPDAIHFDIAGSQTISLATTLPTITDAVVIDGTTDPDYAGAPIIELDGSSAGSGSNGLVITSGGSTIRGLVINRFNGSGIRLETGGSNIIEGNYIGLDNTGTVAAANGTGIHISAGSAGNTIGDSPSTARNVISGNTNDGILISGSGADSNIIRGNYIGSDKSGAAALGNRNKGIIVENGAKNNVIGGSTSGAGNIISGNSWYGIEIRGVGSSNNLIQGNMIGLNANGSTKLGSSLAGIVIYDADNNTIGGTTSGARNIISGNEHGVMIFAGSNSASGNIIQGNFIGTDISGNNAIANSNQGVAILIGASSNLVGGTAAGAGNVISGNGTVGLEIANAGADSNTVQGNLIGLGADGSTPLGNVSAGIILRDTAQNNVIGGVNSGEGNTIAHNGGANVAVQSTAVNNSIRGNSIYASSGLAIDLNNDGSANANDALDGDSGANTLQNTPVLTTATLPNTNNLRIQGNFNSTANASFTLDFYENSGSGSEARRYLGSTAVTTDASGDDTLDVLLTGVNVSAGKYITAIATDTNGNTSEVSTAVQASSNSAPTDISLQITAVDENTDTSSGLNLGKLSATDPDAGETFTWQIIGGADQAKFIIDTGSSTNKDTLYLRDGILDAETKASYEVTIRVTDSVGNTYDKTPTVTVNNLNEAPTGANKTVTTNEDIPYTFIASDFGFADVDGDTLASVKITTLETVGALQLNGTDVALSQVIIKADIDAGNLKFIPVADANGNGYDSFGFSVNDGTVDSVSTYTMMVDVTAVNDAPVIATNTGMTVAEASTGTAMTTSMLNEGDVDDSGAGVTYTVTSVPANGTLLLNTVALSNNDTFTQADIDAGLVTYDHDGSQTASDSFAFSLADGGEDGAVAVTGTFDITITNVNDAPVLAGIEGTTLAYTENDMATAITANTTVSDVDDTNIDSAIIQITGNYQSSEDVLAFSDTANIIGAWDAASGTLSLSGSDTVANYQAALRSITYANSSDNPSTLTRTVSFTVNDGALDSNTQTRNISVTAVNDEQSLDTNTTLTLDEGATATITNTLLSASDLDNSAGQLVYTINTVPANGTLQLSGTALSASDTFTQDDIDNNRVTYVHDGGETTADSFDFSVDDGLGTTTSATFSISVTPVNDAPTAANNTVTTNEDTTYTFTTTDFGFADVDGDTLASVKITTLETVGALQLNGTDVTLNQIVSKTDIEAGNLSFLPGAYAHGNDYDSFSFSVNDGSLDSVSTYVITINVTAVNNAPTIATNTGATFTEASTGNIISNVMLDEGDLDDAGTGLTYTVTTQPTNGTLKLNGAALALNATFTQADIDAGLVTYDHDGSQTSSDSFAFSLTDGGEDGAGTASGTFSITITNRNDAPLNSVPGAQSVDEDTSLSISGIAVADDDDNLATVRLTVTNGRLDMTLIGAASITSGGNHSADLSLSGPLTDINATLASLAYRPAADFNGADTLTVVSTDSLGASDSDTVAITIAAINDAPAGIVSIDNMTPAQGDLLTASNTLSDADGGLGGSIAYQWQRDGIAISGATGSSYITGQGDLGSRISVSATYTDGQGTTESVNSTPTQAVVAINGIADISVYEDAKPTAINLNLAFGSHGQPTSNLKNPAVDVANKQLLSASVSDNQLILTYLPDQFGESVVTVRATTAAGNTIETTFKVAVQSVPEAPIIKSTVNKDENGKVLDLIVQISANAVDSDVTYFQITDIRDGTLYLPDAETVIEEGDFVAVAEANEGLVFIPDSTSKEVIRPTFTVKAAINNYSVIDAAPSADFAETILPFVIESTGTPDRISVADIKTASEHKDSTKNNENQQAAVLQPRELAHATEEDNSSLSTPLVAPFNFTAREQSHTGPATEQVEEFTVLGNGDRRKTVENSTFIELIRDYLDDIERQKDQLIVSSFDSLFSSLEKLREESTNFGLPNRTVIGTAVVTSAGLSAGYVIWMLRGGALISSLMISMPAWMIADPLPILSEHRKSNEDDESLGDIINSDDEEGNDSEKDS